MFDAASLVNRSLDLLPGEGGDALAHDLRRRERTTKQSSILSVGFITEYEEETFLLTTPMGFALL